MCDKEMASGFLNASAETVYGEKSAFTQTEHNIVAAYLITAGKEQIVCVYLVYLLPVSYKCTTVTLTMLVIVKFLSWHLLRPRISFSTCF